MGLKQNGHILNIHILIVIMALSHLYMECANYKIQEKNCQSDCQKYLSRWPVLRVKHIRYQVIMFERVD